jgi:hypothetical protein
MPVPLPARLAAKVINAGGLLAVRKGQVVVKDVPAALCAELRQHRDELFAWLVGDCRGQDLAGLACMARARRSTGQSLTVEDRAALVLTDSSSVPLDTNYGGA